MRKVEVERVVVGLRRVEAVEESRVDITALLRTTNPRKAIGVGVRPPGTETREKATCPGSFEKRSNP